MTRIGFELTYSPDKGALYVYDMDGHHLFTILEAVVGIDFSKYTEQQRIDYVDKHYTLIWI